MKKFIIILLMTFSLTGYSENTLFKTITPINKIIENPDDYYDKELKIKGIVTRSASIFMESGYFIKQNNTEIFVIVSGEMPPKIGEEIKIKGKIKILGSINDKNFIIFKQNKKSLK